VTPADFTGRKEVVPLQRRAGERGDAELSFEFRKQRFCYDGQADAFHKLKYPTQARALPAGAAGPFGRCFYRVSCSRNTPPQAQVPHAGAGAACGRRWRVRARLFRLRGPARRRRTLSWRAVSLCTTVLARSCC